MYGCDVQLVQSQKGGYTAWAGPLRFLVIQLSSEPCTPAALAAQLHVYDLCNKPFPRSTTDGAPALPAQTRASSTRCCRARPAPP